MLFEERAGLRECEAANVDPGEVGGFDVADGEPEARDGAREQVAIRAQIHEQLRKPVRTVAPGRFGCHIGEWADAWHQPES